MPLVLLKMFSSNFDKLFTIKRGTFTTKAGKHQSIFGKVMPLFSLRIFTEKQTPTAKHLYPDGMLSYIFQM